MILLELFLEFFKVGLFCFGGAFGMIPLIGETVLAHGWLTESQFYEFIGVCESTPGPIAVNMATYVGSTQAGFLGSLAATLGVVLPSFVIIALIANILSWFENVEAVRYAFNGVRAGVLALIIKAMISMYKQCPKGILAYCVMVGAFVAAAVLKVNVLLVILCCAVVGLIASMVAERRMRG